MFAGVSGSSEITAGMKKWTYAENVMVIVNVEMLLSHGLTL